MAGKTAHDPAPKGGEGRPSQRIPPALQQVFLSSNRGKEVDKPPPNQAANKTYSENWKHQRSSVADYVAATQKPPDYAPKTALRSSMSKSTRSRRSPPKRQRSATGASPQQHLDNLLQQRGYKIKTYRTLQSAYSNTASKLQMASYGPKLVEICRSNDAVQLQQFMKAGLSPNPCNLFGESLIHMICRRGDLELLKVLLQFGASVQVSDDYGRTPLHDACWSANPSMDLVELLLQQDPRLFYLKDKRGALPLSYVTRDYWYLWRQFIDNVADVYWPARRAREWDEPPELCQLAPNECPLPEPRELPMPLELVSMVSSGRLSVREAQYMAQSGAYGRMRNHHANCALDDDEYSDDDDDSDSDFLSDSDMDSDEEEDEDDFEMQDQVDSMLDMVRGWDSKKW